MYPLQGSENAAEEEADGTQEAEDGERSAWNAVFGQDVAVAP